MWYWFNSILYLQIIEKRRRDRINSCMTELRRLVPQANEREERMGEILITIRNVTLSGKFKLLWIWVSDFVNEHLGVTQNIFTHFSPGFYETWESRTTTNDCGTFTNFETAKWSTKRWENYFQCMKEGWVFYKTKGYKAQLSVWLLIREETKTLQSEMHWGRGCCFSLSLIFREGVRLYLVVMRCMLCLCWSF